MDIPGKGSRDWWSACYFHASCTFAGSELWVTGEVRYLPDGRSSGEKRWHLLALSCGSGVGARIAYSFFCLSFFFFSTFESQHSFFLGRNPNPKQSCKYPFLKKKDKSNCHSACRSARRRLLRAFPFGHVAMCTGFSFLRNCMMHDAPLDTSGKAEAACETACIALAPPTAVRFPPIVASLFCHRFHWWLYLSPQCRINVVFICDLGRRCSFYITVCLNYFFDYCFFSFPFSAFLSSFSPFFLFLNCR